jgi:hypothetical protein
MNFAPANVTHAARHVETTEWEDILVRKGIREERPEVAAQRRARAEAAQRVERDVEGEAAAALHGMSLEQLAEREDDVEEGTLEALRAARLAAIKARAARERFGAVYPLAKADFVREVNEASQEHWVLIDMFKDGIAESNKCSELLRELARRHPAVKFLKIRSTDCVEKWPDGSTPCLLTYRHGKMQRQLIGLDFCGGPERSTLDSMDRAFRALGLWEGEEEAHAEGQGREDGADGARAAGAKPATAAARQEEGQVKVGLGKKVADLPSASAPTVRKGALLDDLGGDDDW